MFNGYAMMGWGNIVCGLTQKKIVFKTDYRLQPVGKRYGVRWR